MKYFEKHPMIMVAVAVIGCAASGVFVKNSDAPSVVTAAVRLLWTVLLLSPVTLGSKSFRHELSCIDRKSLLLACLSGVFLAAHFTIWFESLNYTSVATSTTICCTEVVWVTIIFCVFLKGKVSRMALSAIALTLFGNVMIAWVDFGSGSGLYGDILALIAAILMAAYTMLGKILREKLSTTVYTYICYSACAAVLLSTCLVQGHGLLEYGMSPIVSGLMLALFSTIMGHSIFSWCLKFLSPSFVSASKLCIPVVSAVLAFFFFGEIPTALQLVGCVVILGGMLWYYSIESKNV